MNRDNAESIVWEFPQWPDPDVIARRLAPLRYCLILSSSQRHPHLGRYSFAMADPVDVIELGSGAAADWQSFRQRFQRFSQPSLDGLPPFQGGYAGLFGYELNSWFEAIPRPSIDEFQLPQLALGLYDVVIAWDHYQRRCWILSRGIGKDAEFRHDRARERLAWMQAQVNNDHLADKGPAAWNQMPVRTLETECVPTLIPGVYSNFTNDAYCDMVATAVDRIRAGELFQVNLSQRLIRRAAEEPLEVFLQLQQETRAPFSCYFDLGEHRIVSVSPERFLHVRNGHVEARPIKGTRRGMPNPEADLYAQSDLSASKKDLAENTMIVDLLRNDLSRVCKDDSVRVTQLCGLESYRYVHHLVSVVEGDLADGQTAWDVVRDAFPCGSVTGAPKIRAMQTIVEMEKVARGPYCGSLGYLGLDGAMDLNVLIRTLTFSGGWCQLPVGGGIVADSQPEQEYHETWDKAAGVLRALPNRPIVS